jgi:energy-coupling factor transporter ATP-binding protein EcfA2
MPADNLRQFQSALVTRLERGERLVLYGPCGSGKSTLLGKLHARIAQRGIPCAVSTMTTGLDDITRTLEQAYPYVDTVSTTRREARARLVLAADRNEGVLLLDHVTNVTTAMLGLIRRLRGGIAGVLLAIDVDEERDRRRLPGRHLGISWLPMPLASTRTLRRLFRGYTTDSKRPRITAHQERQLVRAARGRPGWIVQCARLLPQRRYWHGKTLYASVLCIDTEIALRQGDLRLVLHQEDTTPELGPTWSTRRKKLHPRCVASETAGRFPRR